MRGLPQLLKPYLQRSLHAAQLSQIEIYLNLLLKWNAKMNLTAVRDAEEIVRRHFGESLFAGEQLGVTDSHSLIDIGSGAGFPGLPIKILAPHLQVTLIESQQKKVTFLREVIRALNLKNTSVFAGRAEDANLKAQVVTMRAVEKFESTLQVAAGLVEPEGRLALLIGTAQAEFARRQLPLYTWPDPLPIPESRTRILLVGVRNNEPNLHFTFALYSLIMALDPFAPARWGCIACDRHTAKAAWEALSHAERNTPNRRGTDWDLAQISRRR